MITRRSFLETVSVAAVIPAFRSQTKASEWGSDVFDLHFHLRPQAASNLTHLDGAGVTKANLLTRGAALDQVKALEAAAPGRFTWFNSADVTKPEAEAALTQAVKDEFADVRARSAAVVRSFVECQTAHWVFPPALFAPDLLYFGMISGVISRRHAWRVAVLCDRAGLYNQWLARRDGR